MEGGDTSRSAAICSTVTVAAPDAATAVAVTEAVPLPTAVAKPAASTVATDGSPLSHDTVTPSMT